MTRSTSSPAKKPKKLLNVGDTIYQYTWKNFDGTVLERTVETVAYFEHARLEDCFYRYYLRGLMFHNDNKVTNFGLGKEWFLTREDAKKAMDAEIAERRAEHEKYLRQEIQKNQSELESIVTTSR